MITRTVNIHATYDDGTIAANVLVNAILSHADLDPNDGWISPTNITAVTDSNGDASIDVWPDERGQYGSRYRVWAIDDTGNYVFDVWANVPDTAGPHQLADISEPVEPSQDQVGGTLTTDEVENLVSDGIADHEAKNDPHPQYGTGGAQDTHSWRTDNPHGVTAAQAGADPDGSADQALTDAKAYTDNHANDTTNPHQVTASQVGADPAGTAVSEVDSHEAATDPHPQYGTGGAQDTHSGRTDNPHNVTASQAGADPAGTAASEVADHEAKADPHPQYGTGGAQDTHSGRSDNPHQVTASQAGADPSGTATQEVSDHEGKVDPHTQYAERDENLGDLGSAADARTNLGLGTAAEKDVGTGSGEIPTNADLGWPWFEISGDLVLTSSHNHKTAYVKSNAEITLPIWADEDPTFQVRFVFQGDFTLTLATQNSNSVLGNLSSISANSFLVRTPTTGQWGFWTTEPEGTASSLLADHGNASDPHPQYLLEDHYKWTEHDADFPASANQKFRVDTSGNAVTATIPAGMSDGDQILLADAANTWGTNAVTLSKDGAATWSFASGATTTLSQSGVIALLVYDGDSDVVQVFELSTPTNLSWAAYNNGNDPAVSPTSSATGSIVMGSGATDNGNSEIIVIGDDASGGAESTAFGQNTYTGSGSSAFGYGARVVGTDSLAVGSYAKTFANNRSVALGYSAEAEADEMIVIGQGASGSGSQSVVIGENSSSSGGANVSIGWNVAAQDGGITVGPSAKGFGQNSIVVGDDASDNYTTETVILGYKSSAKSGANYSVGLGATSVVRWEHETLKHQTVVPGPSAPTRSGEIMRATSSEDGTTKEIVSAASFSLKADTVMRFKTKVLAIEPATGEIFQQSHEGVIKNIAGTTAIVGSASSSTPIQDSGLSVSSSVRADDTDDGLAVDITGESAKTIRWSCVVEYHDIEI